MGEMNYEHIQAIMLKAGIADDPAFRDVNIAIQPLPAPYNDGMTLGLYYPDEECVVVPPDCDDDTIIHELGHRKGHYTRNDISELFAEKYRNDVMPLVARRVAQFAVESGVGTIAKILEAATPANAVPGDHISLLVNMMNNSAYNASVMVSAIVVQAGVTKTVAFLYGDTADLQPGYTQEFAADFTMGTGNAVITVSSYYYGSDAVWHLDGTKQVTVHGTGEIQSIVGHVVSVTAVFNKIPASSIPQGAGFDLGVFFNASNPGGGAWSVCAVVVNADGLVFGSAYADTGLLPGTALGNNGHAMVIKNLTMPKDQTDRLTLRLLLLGNPFKAGSAPQESAIQGNLWNITGWQTLSDSSLVVPVGIPNDYVLSQDLAYPENATYHGDAEHAEFYFNVNNELGVGNYITDHFLSGIVKSAAEHHATLLTLKIYAANSKKYLEESGTYEMVSPQLAIYCVATAYGPATERVARLPVLVYLVVVITALALLLAITIYVSRWNLFSHDPVVTTQTDVVPPNSTITLAPNQTGTVPGSSDTTNPSYITHADGTKTVVNPGTTATAGPGDTIHTGTGTSATITTKNTTPPTDWTQVVKYGALGLGAIAVAVGLSAVSGIFKK